MGQFHVKGQPVGVSNIVISALASMGGFIFGYDSAQISQMTLMDDFLDRFGEPDPKNPGEQYFSNPVKGAIVGLLCVGALFGALGGAPVADKWGRKAAISLMCFINAVGVIIIVTSQHSWVQIAIGRMVAGFGIGSLSAVVPMYQSECVAAVIRGACVASYQLFVTFGILMAYVWALGTRTVDGSASWRILTGLGLVFPVFTGSFIWFMPESPRWLVKNGRYDEAKRALETIRGGDSPEDQATIEHDLSDIVASVKLEEAAGEGTWTECLFGKKGVSKLAYRTYIGMVIQALQQLTGANYFFYYGATIFSAVGLSDSMVTATILGVVNFVCTLAALDLTQRFGRRSSLIVAGIWQAIWLIVFASAGTSAGIPDGKPDSGMGKLMIVSGCFFIAGFATVYGPIPWVVVGESFPMSTRAKQAAIATASNWLWNFLISFFSPFISNDISYAYGYVFAGCNLGAAIFTFFFIYETAGLSLEHVDAMYSTKGLKPWQSAKWVPEGYLDRNGAIGETKRHDEKQLEKSTEPASSSASTA